MLGRVRRLFLPLLVVSALLVGSPGAAFDSLFSRLPKGGRFSALFGNSEARARVRDGLLLGTGYERTELLPNSRLRIVRSRTYTRVKNRKTGKLVDLPEPWQIHSTLELSPSLRLIRSDTTLELHRSIDRALGYAATDELSELFAWDRALTTASAAGDRLTHSRWQKGRSVDRESYDYPADAIPIEIIATALSIAVRNRVERFDFELLLPGGATHGVRSQIHRTRDLHPFATDYPLPARVFHLAGELAVVDAWLASPLKYLFFPHHFYLVYSAEEPEKLLALWGGNPDEHMQAVRE
jgi:hypothetical protein